MLSIPHYDVIGTLGVALIVIAYFQLQIQRWTSSHLWYSVFNLLGSLLILYSLYFTPNTASIVIEFFWLLISLLGLWKWFLHDSKKTE